MRTKYLILTSMLLLCTAAALSQPTIDGVFDGAALWGSPIASADGQAGWADANMEHLYTTYDSEYLYLGCTNI